jgi:hypothetical protein
VTIKLCFLYLYFLIMKILYFLKGNFLRAFFSFNEKVAFWVEKIIVNHYFFVGI